jgi:hypothetical protein
LRVERALSTMREWACPGMLRIGWHGAEETSDP